MRVILLVAGEGKRLMPFTKDRPKSLVEVDGKSLLNRQIDVLKSVGITEIIAVTGYRSDQLNSFNFSNYVKNERFQDTNMLYSLTCAHDYLDQDVIVSYGDIVYSPEIIKRLLLKKDDIVVAADKNWKSYWNLRSKNPLLDLESFKVNNRGNIIDIGKSVSNYLGIDGQYIGLIKLSKKALLFLKKYIIEGENCEKIFSGRSFESAYMTDMLQTLIDNKFIAKPSFFSEPWVEVDTVEDLKSTETIKRLKSIEYNIEKLNLRGDKID